MNGKAQSIVAAVIIAMLGWIVADLLSFKSQVHSDFAAVRSEIADLREHMARLEGLFQGQLEGDCQQ